MIKANELRIGNTIKWLHEESESIIVVSVGDIEIIDDYNKNEDAEEFSRGLWYSPIPLTPEILEKCGFVKHDNSNEYWTFYQLKSGWYVAWSLHNEPSAGVREGFLYYGDNYQEIKHLHQLQNLYYALTGTELIYKP